ncbi:MAG: thiol-disulfide oxidoreductase DCC family protein [Chitinophagaceae bacterium]|nr:MAG: thiol-disulfide oxidoreductase DCC family protein [Chitinophagaceae bacterium]
MTDAPIILFDGVCNLCNGSVQYVIKHDKAARFKFASLQSEAGQKLLLQHKLPVTDYNSFILVENGKIYTKSTAALMVAQQLDGVVKILYVFRIIPAFIRDAVYNFVAQNRYRFFGKKNQCMIPSPSLRNRFLN